MVNFEITRVRFLSFPSPPSIKFVDFIIVYWFFLVYYLIIPASGITVQTVEIQISNVQILNI